MFPVGIPCKQNFLLLKEKSSRWTGVYSNMFIFRKNIIYNWINLSHFPKLIVDSSWARSKPQYHGLLHDKRVLCLSIFSVIKFYIERLKNRINSSRYEHITIWLWQWNIGLSSATWAPRIINNNHISLQIVFLVCSYMIFIIMHIGWDEDYLILILLQPLNE